MIRIITYLIVSIFGILVSFAQVKSEEITIHNQAIELPGTLTYPQEKAPLIIWVHGSGGVNRNKNQPFLSSWIEIDSTEEIKKITIPTLIINGDKDIQMLVEDAENLKNAKPNAELVIIKNMNHVLKNIEKEEDNLASYYSANFPLSEKLITTIVKFVKE